VVAGEGVLPGELWWSFGALAEEVADLLTGFFGGGGHEAIVANSGKSFGQHMQAPAPDELVRMKVKDAHLLGIAIGAT
jgi:hypothetical protein